MSQSSALPQYPLHGSFEIRDVPDSPPFDGSLVSSLESSVEAAELAQTGGLRILDGQPPVKPSERPWIKLVDLCASPMRCNSVDCPRTARLLIESRDQEVLPYCTACALVEFALWMAGV
jgi:hypothetical protein